MYYRSVVMLFLVVKNWKLFFYHPLLQFNFKSAFTTTEDEIFCEGFNYFLYIFNFFSSSGIFKNKVVSLFFPKVLIDRIIHDNTNNNMLSSILISFILYMKCFEQFFQDLLTFTC